MSLSEKRVLKKLGASSFSDLSVEQLKLFTDLIPDMDNELVKAAMNSFSNFRFMSLVMVGHLQDKLYRTCKQRTKSQRKFFAQTDAALKNLDSVLRDYKGTEEERNTVEDAIIQIAYTVSPFVAGVLRRMKNTLGYTAVGLAALASLAALVAVSVSRSDGDYSSSDDEYDDDYDDEDMEYDDGSIDGGEAWFARWAPDAEYHEIEPDPVLYPEYYYDTDTEDDESNAASDYYDSRPWGPNNDGY